MKMSKILLTAGLLLTAAAAFAQTEKPLSCKTLRHSKLVAVDEEDEYRYVLIRGKKHIEYFGDKKRYIKSNIKWISDCSFKATMTECTVPDFPLKVGAVMLVQFDEYKKGVWHGKVTIGDGSVSIEYVNVEEKKKDNK
ncbi:hypothetical protein D9M68_927300 [compost metagenome]